MIKNLPKRYSIPLLILFIIALYVSLNKLIVPFVLKVVGSDLFFEKETEVEELGKVTNERGSFAFLNCKEAVKKEDQVAQPAQFADADYETWAVGGRTYVVRSHVSVTTDKGLADRAYACKIKFAGGDVADSNNWEVVGVDFTEPAE